MTLAADSAIALFPSPSRGGARGGRTIQSAECAVAPHPQPLLVKGRGEGGSIESAAVAALRKAGPVWLCNIAFAAAGFLAAVIPAPTLAQQQAAVSCEVADFSMTMRLYLPLAPGPLGSPGSEPMQGVVDIHHQKVPKERRIWSLDNKRPEQFWNQGGELKLLLVLGTGQDAISIVIETAQRRGESEYTGAFRLTAPEVRLTGKLACSAG